MIRARFSATALLFALLASFPAFAVERFALLIGANAGWANDRPLRFAEADAERMQEVLVELGGFAPDRVWLLRDPDTAAVRAHLERLAGELRALKSRDQLVVFYYSGHADERHLHLRGVPLSQSELYEALRDLPATVRVGVLDACRSGSILTAKGGASKQAFEVRVTNELRTRGLALLTSSGADELSQEAQKLAGSVFTHHLISGLRGAGDFNGDGTVTLTEVYQYARQQTELDTSQTITPHRPAFQFELAGQVEPVMARPIQGAARLVLPRAEGERYIVVDEHETRLVAEGRTRPGEPMALALAPGIYQVMHPRSEGLEVASIHVTRGARLEAAGLVYVRRPFAAGFLKGRSEMLEGEELREWRTSEVLRLLDTGDAEGALRQVDELLAEQPADPSLLRAKARVLVRLSEAHALRGERSMEQERLSEAVGKDPSLVEDPDFTSRYLWLQEFEAREARTLRAQEAAKVNLGRNAFLRRRWGFGFTLMSPRGLLAPWLSLNLDEGWFGELTLDYMAGSVDLGLRYLDGTHLSSAGCASFSMGGHLSLAQWGVPSVMPFSQRSKELAAQDIWGTNAHIETGWMFNFDVGFVLELSVGLILYVYRTDSAPRIVPMATISPGWLL